MHYLQENSGKKMLLLNPAFLYAVSWFFILAIYSLQLSELLVPLQFGTILLVVGSSFSFIFGWLGESIFKNGNLVFPKVGNRILSNQVNLRRTERRMLIAWCSFFFMLLGEVVYFGGAPILSIFGIGAEIIYTDFGIPGLHGLVNSIFYAACSIQFVRILLSPSSHGKFGLILISILYPILGMSRQVLISLLVQYVLLYLFVRRPSALSILKSLPLLIFPLLIFGYLGDIRSGRDGIIALAAPTFEYPEWLPSAFLWVYIYLCTPLNNVNLNIDIWPNYFPLETAGSLIPSFVRQPVLDALGATRQWELVSETFNVSSLLQSLLTDFGIFGTILFTFFCGIFLSRILRRAQIYPVYFFAIVVFLHGIALSFFANLLFHLVFIFQIIILFLILGKKK